MGWSSGLMTEVELELESVDLVEQCPQVVGAMDCVRTGVVPFLLPRVTQGSPRPGAHL